jgi:biopolymer transport protein ExbB
MPLLRRAARVSRPQKAPDCQYCAAVVSAAIKYHVRTQCGRSSAPAAASCGRSSCARSWRSPSYCERLWTLQSSRVIPRDLSQKVWNWIETDQLSDKLIAALEQNSPLGQAAGHRPANRNKPRAVMVERLEDGGRHVVHELERFLNTLGTIAAVAPLLGLLGTVAGIIHAFNAITANGLGDPRVLSGGIGEALITTAAGLTVAIPSLIAYRFLRGKVERLVVQMEKEAMKLVDALDVRGRLVGAARN